jgi:hypothetical protein
MTYCPPATSFYVTSKKMLILVYFITFIFSALIFYKIIMAAFTLNEGFSSNLESDYAAIRARLNRDMSAYCQLSSYVQAQMKTMYMSPKISEDAAIPKLPPPPPPPPPSPCHWTDLTCKAANRTPQPPPAPKITAPLEVPGDTEADAIARVQRTYKDVYKCRDDLADSRQNCSIPNNLKAAFLLKNPGNVPRDCGDKDYDCKEENFKKEKNLNNMVRERMSFPDYEYIPCDRYMNLPDWPDVGGAAAALSNFPNDIADRVSRELQWYSAIIKQLTEALEMGKNPPQGGPPDSANSPSKDSSGKSWSSDGGEKVEGFEDSAQCSPSAMQARLERERRARLQSKPSEPSKPNPADDPDSCIMPDLATEIRRVNSILSSPQMSNSLGQANSLLGAMKQLQISQQKAKDGTLYAWQQDGPKKSYSSFKGGDRLAGLLFSMKQNQ